MVISVLGCAGKYPEISCLFKLIARIGANKTAYATVLFPIVALTISAFVEGYTFTPIAIIGLVLALLGNVIVFYKRTPSSSEKV